MSKPECIMESWAVTRACICVKLNLKFSLMGGSGLNIYSVVLGVGRKWNAVCCILVDQFLLKPQFCKFLIVFFGFVLFPLPSLRRQYQPLSLQRLQYLIDLGRVDPTQPIDLTQLINARGVTVQPLKRDYGVQLVEEVCTQDTCYLKHRKALGFQFFHSRLFWKHLSFSKFAVGFL